MTGLMTWLAPVSGTTRDQLTAAIDKLAAEHDAPRFQRHVTVLVTFDGVCDAAARRLASLVADMPPFELAFAAIRHEETYFRSLYLRAAPSAQLQALQEAGRQAFALHRLPPAPHLSLPYSGMTEVGKRPIIADLGMRLPLTVCFDAIEIWGEAQGGSRLVPRRTSAAFRGVATVIHGSSAGQRHILGDCRGAEPLASSQASQNFPQS